MSSPIEPTGGIGVPSGSRRALLKSAALGAALGSGLLAACAPNAPASSAPAAAAPTTAAAATSAPAAAAPAGQATPASQPATSGEDVLSRVARTKQLNVAVVVYPPLTENKGGQFSGTFIEAAKWLGQQMKAEPNYIAAEFGTFIAAIQSGRADIALAGSYATVPRAMAVDFTKQVMWFGTSAMVRKGDENKFKSIEDGDQSGVTYVQADGTAIQQRLAGMLKNAKLNTLPPGTSPANMALEVISKHADIYVEDDWLVRSLIQQHPELALMPAYQDKPWDLNAVAWAVAKGQTGMLNVLNVAVDRLTENNMFQTWDNQFGAHWLYKKESYYQGGSATA